MWLYVLTDKFNIITNHNSYSPLLHMAHDILDLLETEDLEDLTNQELKELTELTASIPQRFADSSSAIKGELETVIAAINTWEKIAPQLYQIKKRLVACDELLSGKRDFESASSLGAADGAPEKKKRGPAKGTKTFIRRKSEILNDGVIEKIRDFISADETYHKSKEIYKYLIDNDIIDSFPGDTPDRAFAISLSRVDQDLVKYNNHYTIMAWGLPDFGTPEHARRKALKSTVRGEKGTRVSSYGRTEAVLA